MQGIWHQQGLAEETDSETSEEFDLLAANYVPSTMTLAIKCSVDSSANLLQALGLIRSNKGAGPMLALAALREHGRLRDSAIEVSCV